MYSLPLAPAATLPHPLLASALPLEGAEGARLALPLLLLLFLFLLLLLLLLSFLLALPALCGGGFPLLAPLLPLRRPCRGPRRLGHCHCHCHWPLVRRPSPPTVPELRDEEAVEAVLGVAAHKARALLVCQAHVRLAAPGPALQVGASRKEGGGG